MANLAIIVRVDSAGKWRVELQGDHKLSSLAIGPLEYAKKMALDHVAKYLANENDECVTDGVVDPSASVGRPTLSKEAAISALLDCRNTIDQRIDAIAASDDRATFQVPDKDLI